MLNKLKQTTRTPLLITSPLDGAAANISKRRLQQRTKEHRPAAALHLATSMPSTVKDDIHRYQERDTVSSRYRKIEIHLKLLMSQSTFSGYRKCTVRYKRFWITGVEMKGQIGIEVELFSLMKTGTFRYQGMGLTSQLYLMQRERL